jgi:hypothetical protein
MQSRNQLSDFFLKLVDRTSLGSLDRYERQQDAEWQQFVDRKVG